MGYRGDSGHVYPFPAGRVLLDVYGRTRGPGAIKIILAFFCPRVYYLLVSKETTIAFTDSGTLAHNIFPVIIQAPRRQNLGAFSLPKIRPLNPISPEPTCIGLLPVRVTNNEIEKIHPGPAAFVTISAAPAFYAHVSPRGRIITPFPSSWDKHSLTRTETL